MKEILFRIKDIFLRFKEIIISIILLLLIPSISSYILGYTFSSHVVKNIPTIVVDNDNSSLSKNFVKQVNTNEVFNVTNYGYSNDDVKNLMDKGIAVVGIIIPENFSKDLLDGKAPKIMILYDGSQMSAVSAAKTRIAEILGTIRISYLMQLGEGKLGIMPEVVKNTIMAIQCDSIFLGNPARSTANFVVQGMLIGISQIGIIILGVLIVKKKDNFFLLLIKSIVYGLIGSISILLTLIIQFKYFEMPFKGSIMAAIILTIIFSITTISLGILLSLISKNKLSAVNSSSMIVSSTVLLSGYTFPLMAMPNMFKDISKFIPFLHYGIPMRDLSLLGLSFNEILPDVYSIGSFMVFIWIAILFVLIIKKSLKSKHNFKRKIMNKVAQRRNKGETSKIHS